jgi:hypothetical protein
MIGWWVILRLVDDQESCGELAGRIGYQGWQKALRANPAIFNHQKKGIDSSNSAVGEEKNMAAAIY